MLIDNKFIYLNLPRCASTSFHIACLKNKLSIQYYNTLIHSSIPAYLEKDADSDMVADMMPHAHEKLADLRSKFGNELPVIAVKRNPYERYISLWKHVIDEVYRMGDSESADILKSLDTDDILFYKSDDIHSNNVKYPIIKSFLKKNLPKNTNPYMDVMFNILITPTSYYHHYDKSIIWFDFNKLYELENWVSDMIGIQFKLEKTNSSQHFDCNLKNDDYFRTKYDSIYTRYDNPKSNNSLI